MSENDIEISQSEENTKDLDVDNSSILDPENIGKDNETKKEIESGNIFDDFNADSSLMKEVEKQKENEDKDLYYYLSFTGKIFQNFFIITLIVCAILFAYVYIQKDEAAKDANYLDPFCFIINNSEVSIPDGNTYCSSASYTKRFYEERLSNLKDEQIRGILINLVAIYEKGNFLKSKDVTFLLEKSNNKLQVIEILERFDTLKKDFLSVDKGRIQCKDMSIDSSEKILNVTCDAYSQGYENNGIVGFSGEVEKKNEYVSGTSLSLTNSFLNYIEKREDSGFIVIDKQKLFEAETVSGDSDIGRTTGYTKKTTFNIRLKINF